MKLMQAPVLPEKRKTRHGKELTLVLDLDETLVHCTVDPIANPDHRFEVHFNGEEFQVRKRFIQAVLLACWVGGFVWYVTAGLGLCLERRLGFSCRVSCRVSCCASCGACVVSASVGCSVLFNFLLGKDSKPHFFELATAFYWWSKRNRDYRPWG